ncbi:MAG: hypothetical protein FD143_981 [Ignavibacteria bacterium]|nr:MAG: hypothetical protein FD143_981 [Ignavibacteria bacterium]KAF0161223.1 MAG: hypothetical protein FD188_1134 [Ignavibacteria bacterium]
MIETLNKKIELIDKLIYFFAILFLATLNNSIFLNQFGYFVPLLLLLLKFYLTKQNPFSKTKLEPVFILFIIAEIVSTIFSINRPDAIHNMSKRFLLIPTLYVFSTVAYNFERAKKFVLIYLGAALLTMSVYIGFSYNYYVQGFYHLFESGPGVFQYPITSSELMSFSLIILFAFLINEKLSLTKRSGVALAFLINLAALLATYKRTGWMAAAAGMLFVILLGKKWKLLIPLLVFFVILALIEKNVSKVVIYELSSNIIEVSKEINTKGRAYNVLPNSSSLYISDFENGLNKHVNASATKVYDTGTPVVSFKHWKDNFYLAYLVDTRFILLQKDSTDQFTEVNETITSGFTEDWYVANNYVYVVDKDSGLTIIKDPLNLKSVFRITGEVLKDYKKVYADSLHLVLFSKTQTLTIYNLINGLPTDLAIQKIMSEGSNLVFYKNNRIIISSQNGLELYKISGNKLELLETNSTINGAFLACVNSRSLFITTTRGNVFEFSEDIQNLKTTNSFNLGFTPRSTAATENQFVVSYIKRNRILSSFDPYAPSNFSRLALWRAGLLIWKDYPFFGVGDIDLAVLYRQYKRPFDKEIQGHLHNNYFHILATLGLFGFIAVMILLIKMFFLHINNYKLTAHIPFASSFTLGASGCFIAFVIAGLTEWNFGDHEIITMVWFTLALSIAFAKNSKSISS